MTASQDLHVTSSVVKESIVRGHHVYIVIWTPVIGELLVLRAEDNNEHNDHAVAVVKGGDVVGHVLRSISRIAWFFLKRIGNITCCITEKRNVGVGLEVPCVYTFSGSIKALDKLSRLLCEDSHIPIVACMRTFLSSSS